MWRAEAKGDEGLGMGRGALSQMPFWHFFAYHRTLLVNRKPNTLTAQLC